jgi:hypothetical protein
LMLDAICLQCKVSNPDAEIRQNARGSYGTVAQQ